MSESLSDILVVSDMDGTLLTSDKRLLSCNLETIRMFRMLGGHFTVATGRSPMSVEIYPELAKLIEPAITNGGCVLYDFEKGEAKKVSTLPHLAARQALRDVLATFPRLGAMVFGNDLRLYQAAPSDQLQTLITDEIMAYFARPVEDMPEKWVKLLFAGTAELLAEVKEYVEQRTYPGLYFVSTSLNYFEAMPKGASKGSALHDLTSMMGISIKNTYAIGDYYNDLDMMKQAGHSVAVGNAPQDVQMEAGEVVDANDNCGVAQFLYKLVQKYAP